jgi:hypothetical protein
VDVHGVHDRQSKPLDSFVSPRVWARGGGDGPGHDEHGARRYSREEDALSQPGRTHRVDTAVGKEPRFDGDDDRQSEGRQPEQEMRHDRERMEVDSNRDRPKRNLPDDDEERRECRSTTNRRQTLRSPSGEPGREGECEPYERNHPVAELDERVKALLGVRLVAATRPVLAAEPRAGEPDERTRRDHEE